MSCSQTPPATEDSLYTIDDIDTVLSDECSPSNERLCNSQRDKTSQQDKGHELCIEVRNAESEGDPRVVEEDSPKLWKGDMAKEQPMNPYSEDDLGGQYKESGTKGDIKILDTDAVENETKIRDNNLSLDHQNSEKNGPTSPVDLDVCGQDMKSELHIKDKLGVDCGIPNRHDKPKEGIHRDGESTIDDKDNGSSIQDADEDAEEDADSEENLPVDKGWAWVILAGTFLNTMLFVGYVKSLSILFVEYLRLFEASATTTSLIMGVLSASYSISALITMHFVLERLAVRKTALLGGLISTIAMATGVFAPNITFLICVHSVFTGIGHSMLLGPGLVLIGQYFNRRRGLAVSISMSSISVGAGVFPMLTRLLLDRYHIRGTMLIFTGLTMNIFVGASLFRPFDSKQRKTRKIEIKVDDSNGNTLKEQPALQTHLNGSDQTVERELCTSKEQYVLQTESAKCSIREPLLRKSSGSLCESCPSQEGQSPACNDHSSYEEEPHCVQIRTNTINPLLKDTEHNVTECSIKRSLPRKNILSQEHLTVPLNQNSQGRGRTLSHCSRRSHHEDLASSRKLLYASNPETLSASVINLATSDCGSGANSQSEDGRRKPGCNIIDLTLFEKPMFRLFAVSAMFGIVSNIVPNYLPAFVNEKGIDQTDAALLLLLLGTVDFFSRIAIGYFVDLKIIRPSRLIAIGLICAGTSAQLARLYNTFPLMVMFSVIHGIVGSAYQSLVPILIVDFLGKEYLGKTLGYSSMFHGMSLAITHPIIGAIKDISGTFNNTYTYLGTCAYIAALCLLIGEPLCRRRVVDVKEYSNQKV